MILKTPFLWVGGGPLATAAFNMGVGEVSSPVENANKTFSLVRVESFIEEEPFTLEKVYKQIERKIIKKTTTAKEIKMMMNN